LNALRRTDFVKGGKSSAALPQRATEYRVSVAVRVERSLALSDRGESVSFFASTQIGPTARASRSGAAWR